jgi:FkbM family methyltransferase
MLLKIETLLRVVARKLGVIGHLHRIKVALFGEKNYEEAFEKALLSEIKSGDVVYDIGANIGEYTEKFALQVGATGQIIAFEPSPSATAQIIQRCQNYPQVRVFQLALSDSASTMALNLGQTADSPANSLASNKKSAQSIMVSVQRADETIIKEELRNPNILKIDVEGFEPEVLAGFGKFLSETTLRAIFLEVHFTILDARGKRYAPDAIVATMKNSGFSVRWTDSSHLVALRRSH